jgi:hypothetical protein
MLVSPAAYRWLLPVLNVDIDEVVELAKNGRFPIIDEILYPAMAWAVLFGLVRLVMTFALFKVSKNKSLNLEHRNLVCYTELHVNQSYILSVPWSH